ncbi:MAG: hypothetical protein QOD76_1502, partial [Solirubrobacteraceae bacterium]|nr:hypothetical protein [Solirubrobacteraceae bacterium]
MRTRSMAGKRSGGAASSVPAA